MNVSKKNHKACGKKKSCSTQLFFMLQENSLGEDSAERSEAASTNDKYFGKTQTPYVPHLLY